MSKSVCIIATEKILESIYPNGERLLSSFLFGKPGAPAWQHRTGAEIFVDQKKYLQALLYLRENGAPFLRDVSIEDLWSMVAEFLRENFWYIKSGMFSRQPDISFADQIDYHDKLEMSKALEGSKLFDTKNEISLYPLMKVRVNEEFIASQFCLLKPGNSLVDQCSQNINDSLLEPAMYPPFKEWSGPTFKVVSWLLVRSPIQQVSRKFASAILGALALTPIPRYRYMCSMEPVFGGVCCIDDSTYTIIGDNMPHTPPLMYDIILSKEDHKWLSIIVDFFGDGSPEARSKLRALEYFFRAWFLDPRERFPILNMSLDSLVNAKKRHTDAAISFVTDKVEVKLDVDRLKLLLKVRGAVIHGAAPDVYDSQFYIEYYEKYETDPIRDLELIVAKCLRESVFSGTLKCRDVSDKAISPNTTRQRALLASKNSDSIIPEEI